MERRQADGSMEGGTELEGITDRRKPSRLPVIMARDIATGHSRVATATLSHPNSSLQPDPSSARADCGLTDRPQPAQKL